MTMFAGSWQVGGSIHFEYLDELRIAQLENVDPNPRPRCPEDLCGYELIELMPPHRPMWVRVSEKFFLQAIWVARIEMPLLNSDDQWERFQVLCLLANQWGDDVVPELTAFPMSLLALHCPDEDQSLESCLGAAEEIRPDCLKDLSARPDIHGGAFYLTGDKEAQEA